MGSRIGSSGPLTPSTPPPDCEKAAQLITSNFDKMQAYSKVIIGLGYGALLAIWSGTQRSLTQRSRIASGLLILISILAYILFEIGQMLWFAGCTGSGLPPPRRRVFRLR